MRLIAVVAGVSLMAAEARALSQPVLVAAMHGELPDAEPPASGTLTVPAGTLVALTLVSLIKTKSTPIGGTVRAQVAFPISVGDHVAIPVGTFVEGQLVQAKSNVKAKKHQPKPQDLIVHFTRLVFANGYTVGLDATNTAEVMRPDLGLPRSETGGMEVAALEYPALGRPGGGEAMLQQTGYPPTPTLPPLPPLPGPNPVVVSLAALGGVVVLGTVLYFSNRGNHEAGDVSLRDAGWQFEISLGSPLVLDAAQVQAAQTGDAVPAN
jgi:type IV secretion system protein VirB10